MQASQVRNTDWLLKAGKTVIWLFMAVFTLSLLLLAAGLANGIAGYAGLYGKLPATAIALTPEAFPWTVALILAAAALFAMALRFTLLLGGIVDSVAEGDPFSLANAGRLRTMAWLALAFQILSSVVFWRTFHPGRLLSTMSLASGDNLSLNGLLLALVLFVLARVFRKGAEMRADLEGLV